MAALAYVLFFLPLLTNAKNDAFVKFHVKQSLVLLITSVAWNVVGWFVTYLPFLGWVVGGIVGLLVSIALFVLWIKGLMNALNGKMEELPIIGQYAKNINFL